MGGSSAGRPAPRVLRRAGPSVATGHGRRDELLSQRRLQGVDRAVDVRDACMEGNGAIGVVSVTSDGTLERR